LHQLSLLRRWNNGVGMRHALPVQKCQARGVSAYLAVKTRHDHAQFTVKDWNDPWRDSHWALTLVAPGNVWMIASDKIGISSLGSAPLES